MPFILVRDIIFYKTFVNVFLQLGDLPAHLHKIESDINRLIPDRGFDGLAVIDWESWRPTWSRNYDSKAIYQKLSRDLEHTLHPKWNQSQIEKKAEMHFEKSAR